MEAFVIPFLSLFLSNCIFFFIVNYSIIFTIEIENDCRIRIRIFSRVEFALLHNFSMREKYSSVSSDLVNANTCEEMFKIFGT